MVDGDDKTDYSYPVLIFADIFFPNHSIFQFSNFSMTDSLIFARFRADYHDRVIVKTKYKKTL